MRISILNENAAGKDFEAWHGLSYFIAANGHKLLWDTGSSMAYIKNAQKLGIDVDDAELIALSHGHWDHTNGLMQKYRGRKLEGKGLVCHPDAFIRRYRKSDQKHHGAPLTSKEAEAHFAVHYHEEPRKLFPGIWFLGEIPRKTAFEPFSPLALKADQTPDLLPDDTALAIVEHGKLHVVTGCSHSGIVNIVRYAQQVTGISQVETVIGGFHLQQDDQRTRETVRALMHMRIPNLLPGHCTELPALSAFYRAQPFRQLKSGAILDF